MNISIFTINLVKSKLFDLLDNENDVILKDGTAFLIIFFFELWPF